MASGATRRRFIVVKWLIRGTVCALGLLLFVLTAGLYVLERHGLSGSRLNRLLAANIPADELRVEVDRAFFSLSAGVRVEGVRAWLPGETGDPYASCGELHVGIGWFSGGSWAGRIRSITAERLFFPTDLPDAGDAPAKPYEAFRFPEGLDARLTLADSDVSGIRVVNLEGRLHTDAAGHLCLSGAEIVLAEAAGRAPRETIRGDLRLNLVNAVIGGSVEVAADPRRINGLFTLLRLPEVQGYINAFEFKAPVRAACTFEAGLLLVDNLCKVRVNFDAATCTYRAVPLSAVSGVLTVEGARDCLLTVGPLDVRHADSSRLAGTLVADFGSDSLDFDVESALPLPDLYALINQPFTALIPEMAFKKGPALTLSGFVPLNGDPQRIRLNGKVNVTGGGHILKLPFERATTPITMAGGTLTFDPVDAALRDDATLVGSFALTFPADSARGNETDFQAAATITKANLADLMLPFNSEKNALSESGSKVDGTLALTGTFCDTLTNSLASLDGSGTAFLSGGHLNRFHFFAGLTDFMANNIPGLSSITDQSSAKAAFTIQKGLLQTGRLEITGDVLSVEGSGTYSLPADQLDFALIVVMFAKESFMGNVTRWVTVPMTRFLMEFEVSGPLASPAFHRKGTIRKITDTINPF